MKSFSKFMTEKRVFFKGKKITIKQLKLLAKGKELLVDIGNGKEVSIDVSEIESNGDVFGLDRDANEVEINIKDIESVQTK